MIGYQMIVGQKFIFINDNDIFIVIDLIEFMYINTIKY